MNIEKILKNLKNIEPDQEYTSNSRLVVLSTPQIQPQEWSLSSYLFTRRKIAIVASLIAVLAVFILGGLFGGGNSSGLTGLDPISLKAEAQAIDIQIKLAGLVYENPDLINKTTTTPSLVLDIQPKNLILLSLEEEEINDIESTKTDPLGSEKSLPVSVDGILEILSQ